MCYHQPAHKNSVSPAAQEVFDELYWENFDQALIEEPELYEHLEREFLRLYSEDQP